MHISVLEMWAVVPALAAFLPQLSGQTIVLMSDNTTVVAYLRNQEGTVSRVMSDMALEIVQWTDFILLPCQLGTFLARKIFWRIS